MINPKYTEMGMYDKSFKIFNELLLNPVADEDGFFKSIFDVDKKLLFPILKGQVKMGRF